VPLDEYDDELAAMDGGGRPREPARFPLLASILVPAQAVELNLRSTP
jgi:hypothetical protein